MSKKTKLFKLQCTGDWWVLSVINLPTQTSTHTRWCVDTHTHTHTHTHTSVSCRRPLEGGPLGSPAWWHKYGACSEFEFATFKGVGLIVIKGNLPWLGWTCTKGENVSAIFSLQSQVPCILGLPILLSLGRTLKVTRCPEQSLGTYSLNYVLPEGNLGKGCGGVNPVFWIIFPPLSNLILLLQKYSRYMLHYCSGKV